MRKDPLELERMKFPIGEFQKPSVITARDLEFWMATLETFPSQIKILTAGLSVEELNWIYRPNGWSIKQVVHHCADSHINCYIRFKLALTEENPTIKPYEEGLWANLADGNSDVILPTLQLIESLHFRWVALLKSLTTVDLARKFTHPANNRTYSLDEVVGLYAWHCNHHLAHVIQALEYKGQF